MFDDSNIYPNNAGADNLLSGMLWNEFFKDKNLLRKLSSLGCSHPSGIQGQVLHELLLRKKNTILFQSQHGTGKTLASLLAIFASIDTHLAQIQALVVVSSVEEAMQVAFLAQTIAKYGLMTPDNEVVPSERPHVLICTPGSLIRSACFMHNGAVDLSQIKCLVFDNVERLLDLGVSPILQMLIDHLPASSPLLISSTMLGEAHQTEIRKLVSSRQPIVEIPLKDVLQLPGNISHLRLDCPTQREKLGVLRSYTDEIQNGCIIFCPNESDMEEILETAKDLNLRAAILNRTWLLPRRRQVIKAFQESEIDILITNMLYFDCRERFVPLIINWHLPSLQGTLENVKPNYRAYVNLSGIVGCFGRLGSVLNLVDDSSFINDISVHFKKDIKNASKTLLIEF